MAENNPQMKKYLRGLTKAVDVYLKAFDAEMAKPSDYERGRRIAALSNHLEMANDMAKRFGLGKR